jgi:hypothetical protein
LRTRVERGAPMPSDAAETLVKREIDFEAGRQFWSFQPVKRHPLPTVSDSSWPQRAIDHFILAKLEERSWGPSPRADRRTLIRRASFDLLGLPPSKEDVAAFESDDSPDAWPKLVDRLLANKHHGELWGRYWLDLARYSDATASWLSSLAQAWLYRDWTIEAHNADMPYDQFVKLQLAADSLPGARIEDLPALGFLGLSPVYWKELMLDKEVIKGTVAEEYEERIDCLGRTFLGLSLACARCHDHKFDPIGAADYYGLAGVLASSRLIDRPLLPEAEAKVVLAAREKVQPLAEEIKKLEAQSPASEENKAKIEELRKQIAEIEAATPHYNVASAHALDDAALYVLPDGPNATRLEYRPGEAQDLAIQIRGNPSNLGPVTPRRFLNVFHTGEPPPFTHGSGRRDLAEALVGEAAPLAARVIVNRVWKRHFGRGIVETPSDFGAQGAPPTHPELLDDLAARFIESGWSLKWLHRELMLSAAYQQSSTVTSNEAADPENRWLWRMNRRRLEVEAWRDAMLAAAGELDESLGGAAGNLSDVAYRRRTVYGRVDRYEVDDLLRLHDFPDPAGHSPGRDPTTTALQQLYVLNGPSLRHLAGRLAQRWNAQIPEATLPASDVKRVQLAYRWLYQREPSEAELRLAVEFLASGDAASSLARQTEYAQVLLGGNELLFID